MTNFSGKEVNIVGQAMVTLSCREHQSKVTLLIQKGTASELLLGTDVLGKLDFQVLRCNKDGKPHDLLSTVEKQEPITEVPMEEIVTYPMDQEVTVKVLRAQGFQDIIIN